MNPALLFQFWYWRFRSGLLEGDLSWEDAKATGPEAVRGFFDYGIHPRDVVPLFLQRRAA